MSEWGAGGGFVCVCVCARARVSADSSPAINDKVLAANVDHAIPIRLVCESDRWQYTLLRTARVATCMFGGGKGRGGGFLHAIRIARLMRHTTCHLALESGTP